jgi:hypothetical protein
MKRILRFVVALAIAVPVGGSVAVGPAGAAKDDCRPDGQAKAFHCVWDQVEFQGNLKGLGPGEPADLAGQCVNFSIRSAANNGKSGFATLYVYEQPNCAGTSALKLNAGESAPSVTAQSARFGPKGAYP